MSTKPKAQSIDDRVLSLEYGEEKTERHYSELKDKVDNVSEDITAIKNAVIGNTMNGGVGMVTDIKKLKNEVFDLQVKCIKYELYFKQSAVALSILSAGLISALIKIFL